MAWQMRYPFAMIISFAPRQSRTRQVGETCSVAAAAPRATIYQSNNRFNSSCAQLHQQRREPWPAKTILRSAGHNPKGLQ